MIEEIVNFLRNKKIIILGFGIEGKSTYNFIRRYLPEINLVVRYNKSNIEEEKKYLEKDNNLQFITGDEYLEGIENADLIIKSPGISFKNVDISKFENRITSELELFLEYTKSLCIGVTGTKGKSTTSSLVYEVIKEQGIDVELLGNIGIPIFDEIEKIKKDTITVLELSSHALQYVKKSPNISILLNVFEEHLDHYKSFDEYRDAKFNIFKFQKEKDFAIFNLDNNVINDKIYTYKKEDYGVTINNSKNNKSKNTVCLKDNYIWINNEKVYDITNTRKLKGNHNLNDIMFVLAVCKILNLDFDKATISINEFNPLEHRLEFVGEFNKILYYNDSIATIPEATIESIKALEEVNTLIVGGNDRGVNQKELIQFLKNSSVDNILCLPKTGEYIYDGLKEIKKKNVEKVDTLKEAVRIAKKITKKNSICLLSPAASSYGYFKNFKERGNLFKEYVKNRG